MNKNKKTFFVRSEWAAKKVNGIFGVTLTPTTEIFNNIHNVGCSCCPRVFAKKGWKFTLENMSSRELKRKFGIISNVIN